LLIFEYKPALVTRGEEPGHDVVYLENGIEEIFAEKYAIVEGR
jgi:hypothetical protein